MHAATASKVWKVWKVVLLLLLLAMVCVCIQESAAISASAWENAQTQRGNDE